MSLKLKKTFKLDAERTIERLCLTSFDKFWDLGKEVPVELLVTVSHDEPECTVWT